MPQASTMRSLFDRVAGRYDLANRVLSAGSDVRWRHAVAREVIEDKPALVLDACSGTADQALAILDEENFHGKIVCADISWEMLRRGCEKMKDRKHDPIAVLSDMHRVALRKGIFDCITLCFGVRNFDNVVEGLREMGRVLRPAGKIVILEFTRPKNPWIWRMYRPYLTKVLPCIGGMLTGQRDAYRYLASSIEAFLTPDQLGQCLESAGFQDVRHRFLTSSVVALTTARKKKD